MVAALGPAGVLELESDPAAGKDLGFVPRHESHADRQTTSDAEVLTASMPVLSTYTPHQERDDRDGDERHEYRVEDDHCALPPSMGQMCSVLVFRLADRRHPVHRSA